MFAFFVIIIEKLIFSPYAICRSTEEIITHSKMVAVDTENMGLNNIIRKWYKKFTMAWIEESSKILWRGELVLICYV